MILAVSLGRIATWVAPVILLAGLVGLVVEVRDRSLEVHASTIELPDPTYVHGPKIVCFIGLFALVKTALRDVGDLFEPGATIYADFAVYYHAAPALLRGLNPYDALELAEASGQHDLLGCYYPPLSVALFGPVSSLEFLTAGHVLLAFKLLLLAGLLWLWARQLGPWALVVSASLWSYTLATDLTVGNVSIFEQALLWAGVAALLRGRRLTFAGLIAAAAVFKIQMISMVVLALVVDPRKGWRIVCVALSCLTAYLLLGAWLFPGPTQAWFESASKVALSEGGFHAPSLAAALAHEGTGRPTYLLCVGLVLCVSAWVLRHTRDLPAVDRLGFAVLAITLVWPRLKDYGFIVLIPPAAWLLVRLWTRTRKGGRIACVGVLLAIVTLTQENRAIADTDYRPLVLLVLLWLGSGAVLWLCRRDSDPPGRA